ncbi:MAG TPA: ABC transporter permease, partial [Candidatus Micrarchaeaceae archaeon]|nr:ABC transporter permease [Candidatus Micrarchaeaceae archaeon]
FMTELGTFATGRSNALYFALGNALQLTAINGIFGVISTVGNERQFGTLPILLASPANRLVTFVGRAFVHVLDGMAGVVVGLALATVMFGLDLSHANLGLLAACVVIISLSTAGLGLMFGSLSLIMRDVFFIANAAYYLLLVFCGINFPVDRLPVWAQVISNALPLTRGVQAARDAVAGGGLSQMASLLSGELAVGLVYAVIGYALFIWLENQARRGGLQEAY